jgi:hypothetical protein
MRSRFAIYTNGVAIWNVYFEDNNIVLETDNAAFSFQKEVITNWILHNNMELIGYL